MKQAYFVQKVGSTYKCVERTTNHVLRAYEDRKSAEVMCEFWNNGGGFAGFTPAFICAEPFLPVDPEITDCTFTIES